MTFSPMGFESPEKATAYLRGLAHVRAIAPVQPMAWQGFLNVESAFLAGGRMTSLVRHGAANASVWAVLLVPSEKSWARGQVAQEDGRVVGIVQTLLNRFPGDIRPRMATRILVDGYESGSTIRWEAGEVISLLNEAGARPLPALLGLRATAKSDGQWAIDRALSSLLENPQTDALGHFDGIAPAGLEKIRAFLEDVTPGEDAAVTLARQTLLGRLEKILFSGVLPESDEGALPRKPLRL
jgi:hypothetical protein